MDRLRRRADFVALRDGRRAGARSFTLRARARGDGLPARVGFTVTRKIGGAVERNRIRRRLRDAVRRQDPLAALPGFDYVLIARREVLDLPFEALKADIAAALARVHGAIRRPAASGTAER